MGRFTRSMNVKKALAEIILIFIGVTIAIWFDNWNNDRLNTKREIEILTELDGDLEFLIHRLRQKIHDDSMALASGKIIYRDLLSDNNDYRDTLDRHYARFYVFSVPGIKKTAFETMKSVGIDIITNDTIRTGIIDLYDRTLNLVRWSMDWETTEFNDKISPLLDRHIKLIEFLKQARPISYRALKVDQEFINTLNNYNFQKQYRIEIVRERIVGIEKLQANIKSEIKRLQ